MLATDGSTIVARTEDSQNGVYAQEMDRGQTSRRRNCVITSRFYQLFEIDLPDNPVRNTAFQMPFLKTGSGESWDQCL